MSIGFLQRSYKENEKTGTRGNKMNEFLMVLFSVIGLLYTIESN